MMCKRFLALLAIFAIAHISSAEKRTIVCKTPAVAASCYWTHGRLGFYEGAVNWRLWKIGTHNLLGIYSGPATFRDRYQNLDGEAPQLPANLQATFDMKSPPDAEVFADFEVCPLDPHIPGHMQAACIESAKHLVVTK